VARIIPGNRVEVTEVAYAPPVREVAAAYGLVGHLQAGMHQPPGLRYGHPGSWESSEAGPSHAADGTANPAFTQPFPRQLFTGAEAFRLAATRAAERRDYRGEVEAAVFRPLGAL